MRPRVCLLRLSLTTWADRGSVGAESVDYVDLKVHERYQHTRSAQGEWSAERLNP